MQTMNDKNYEELLKWAHLLPQKDKKRLIADLQKNTGKKGNRTFGKYEGQGWISEDFNTPLNDFKEYMP